MSDSLPAIAGIARLQYSGFSSMSSISARQCAVLIDYQDPCWDVCVLSPYLLDTRVSSESSFFPSDTNPVRTWKPDSQIACGGSVSQLRCLREICSAPRSLCGSVTIRPGQTWKGFSTESIFNLCSWDEILRPQVLVGNMLDTGANWRISPEKALWQAVPVGELLYSGLAPSNGLSRLNGICRGNLLQFRTRAFR